MFSKKVLIPFLIFVGVVLIGTTIAFLGRSRIGDQLDLTVRGPQQVFLGVPFELDVSIANTSRSVLEETRLTVTLPEGVIFIGSAEEKNSDFRTLGTIGSGSVLEETFTVMVLDGENTIKRIEADLSYSPETIGARFEKTTDFDISIGKAALALDIITPQQVLSGENFEIDITYVNNSEIEFDDLSLRLEYPPAFTFDSASLDPDEDNNTWNLGSLRPGSENDFSISGAFVGPDNSFFEIRGFIEAEIDGETYVVSKNVATVSISPSPLALKIFLNENPNFVAKLGDRLQYTLAYHNNTDVTLRDVIITAKLTGVMFDIFSISSDAVFRSIDNTLIWNAATNPELALVGPGERGEVDFNIRLRDSYPIQRLGDRNFTIKVNGQIESPTVPYFLAADRTIGLAAIETKVAGAVAIQSKGLFRDAASGIINEGPLPPRAEQSTQYSIHWIITNYSTDIENVEVRTFLEGNTRFVRVVSTNTNSVPIYNSRTQEIVWNIDSITATRGVLSDPIEAVFQIETTPSVTDVGRYAPLMRETFISATDAFTGVTLQNSADNITTRLRDDPTIDSNAGRIAP